MTDEILNDVDDEEQVVEKKSGIPGVPTGPLSIAAIIVAILGGGASGFSFIRGDGADDVEDRCRAMVATHAENAAKTRAVEWASHRREDSSRYASQTDVAPLTVKIDLVMETVREIRDELRDNRRRRGPGS